MNKLAALTTRYARRFQRSQSPFALIMCAVFAFALAAASHTALAAYNLLSAATTVRNGTVSYMMPQLSCGVTLTTPALLLDVIDAFVKEFPLFAEIASEFRGTPLKLNQKYIAHVASYGSASTYDPTTGYANGANTARNGLTDVPVVTDQQPTYPLKWLHLDAIKDIKMQYQKVMAGAGYILGKSVADTGIFAKCTSRYFSYEYITATADFDFDALQALTTQGNSQGMQNVGRILIINSAVAQVLGVDPRMISSQFAGQLQDGRAFRQWRNVAGFALIQEYPDLPSNNGSTLTTVTATAATDVLAKAAHGLVTADPVTISAIGGGAAGLTTATRYWVIGIDTGTFKLATTRANAIAGTAIDVTSDSSGAHLTMSLFEGLTAMMFDIRAFAYLQGAPDGIDGAHAASLGIPQTLAVEPVTSDKGITMAAAKFQNWQTGDYYWVPTFIYGTNAGKQGDTAVAGNTAAANSVLAAAQLRDVAMDKAGLRVTTGV